MASPAKKAFLFDQKDEKGLVPEEYIYRADVAMLAVESLNNWHTDSKTFGVINTTDKAPDAWLDELSGLFMDAVVVEPLP